MLQSRYLWPCTAQGSSKVSPGDHNTSRKRNDSTLYLITSPARLRLPAQSAETTHKCTDTCNCSFRSVLCSPRHHWVLAQAVPSRLYGRCGTRPQTSPFITPNYAYPYCRCGERKVYQGAHSSLTFIFLLAIACLGTHGCFSSEESALGRNERNEVSNAVAYYYNSRPRRCASAVCARGGAHRRRCVMSLRFCYSLHRARRSAQVPAL